MIEPLRNQIRVPSVSLSEMHKCIPGSGLCPSSCPLSLIGRVKCTEQTEWMRLIEYLLVKKKKRKILFRFSAKCYSGLFKIIRSYSEQAIAMQTANKYLHLDQTQVMFRISNNSIYICALLIIICLFGFIWLYFVFTAVRLSLKLLFQDVLHSSSLAFS